MFISGHGKIKILELNVAQKTALKMNVLLLGKVDGVCQFRNVLFSSIFVASFHDIKSYVKILLNE